MKRGKVLNFVSLSENKKGLAPLLISVLLVSLAVVAVGIVWVILSGVLKSSQEEVDFGQSKISLKLRTVHIESNLVSVKINRLNGLGEMDGIRFIFSDGKSSEFIENLTLMEELEEKTFYMSLTKLNSRDLQTVSIAPLLVLSSGNQRIGNILDTYKISSSNYNQSFYDQQSCSSAENCSPTGYPEISGSSVCNLTTGNIETLWTVYSCVSSICYEEDVFRISQICPEGGCYENATCVLTPCAQASNCGSDGFQGLSFCDSSSGDIYQNYVNYFCIFGFCQNGVSQLLIQECDDWGCFDGENGGECSPGPDCIVDSNCGEDSFLEGSEMCEGNEVWAYWRDNYCSDDNTCSNNVTLVPKEGGNCSAIEGDWVCIMGACFERIECTEDSHCNPEGTCGKRCVDQKCVVEDFINWGFVNSIWPSDMGEYFDSSSLPTEEEIYLNHFVRFTSGDEQRCLRVKEHVYPTPPGENSYLRFDIKSTGVAPGDRYEVWLTQFNCECTTSS